MRPHNELVKLFDGTFFALFMNSARNLKKCNNFEELLEFTVFLFLQLLNSAKSLNFPDKL